MNETADQQSLDQESQTALFEYLLRLGDDRLVLGHRLSEWVGHGPILEEDLALGNIALDLIGQAQALLALAGKVEAKGRNEDTLAYFREVIEFCNLQLVELPRGDYAHTIARQFLFDNYSALLMEKLQACSYAPLAAIAAKCFKEDSYHLRHSSQWILRLGDGTQESHQRIQEAIDSLWTYTGEFFTADSVDQALQQKFNFPNLAALKSTWQERVNAVLTKATLQVPSDGFMASGSRKGMHTEFLGKMLAEMQSLPRAHPGAEW